MKRIFLAGVFSPEMPSVGDHAQLYALEQFLAEKFSDYQIVKYCRSDPQLYNRLLLQVEHGDLIFICSSGDFGDRYAYSGWHETRKKIISTFKDNRVIQLPVSVCYLSNCNFEVDKSFFCNLPHFTLLCRTPESAEMLKANFNCDVRFFPDFVFYLKPNVNGNMRSGALVVMRKDDEACFAPVSKVNAVMNKLSKYGLAGRAVNKVFRTLGYGNYVYQNDVLLNEIKRSCQPVCFKDVMVSDSKVTDESRKTLIKSLLELFSQYKVVVTDRFHAAVFAMLTGTPCVALPTGIKDKIKGCSQLLPNTLYADSLKELPDAVKQALDLPTENMNYSPYFDSFRDIAFNPEPAQGEQSISNDTLTVIKNRRSIRKFDGSPLPQDKIAAIVEAGVYAPSAANMQATRFKVITDPALIQQVCNQCSPWLTKSKPSLIIAVCYNMSQPNHVGITMKSRFEPWKRFIWQDTACAMQNMMLAAESLGLASCWASISPSRFNTQEATLRKLLALHPDHKLTSLLLVGYPLQTVNYETAIHQGFRIKRNFKESII